MGELSCRIKHSCTLIFVDEKIKNGLMGMSQASGYPSYRFIDKNGKYKYGVMKWIKRNWKVGGREIDNFESTKSLSAKFKQRGILYYIE